jgi:hypothetical protein
VKRDCAAELKKLIEESRALGSKFDSNDFDDEYEKIERTGWDF